MKKYILLSQRKTLLSVEFCLLVVAIVVTINTAFAVPPRSWYVLGSIGYTIPTSSGSSVKNFRDHDYPNDTYHPSAESGRGILSLEIGRIFHLQKRYVKSLSLGLALKTGNIKEQGDITSLNLPQQYKYDGKASFVALLAMSRVSIFQWPNIRLGVSGLIGMGVSYNRAYSYSEAPQSCSFDRNVLINNHKQIQFSYVLGLSVHKVLSKNLLVILNYEYLNAGKAQYGRVSTTGAQGPGIGVKMHIFSFGLQYQF